MTDPSAQPQLTPPDPASPEPTDGHIAAGVVASLACYPVKGCAAMPVTQTQATPAGLAHDRSFMVVDDAGVFRSQRYDPRLALVRPWIDPDGHRLTLRAPHVDPIRVSVDRDGPRRQVRLFGARYQGIDQGDAVAEWLTDVLGRPSRLVRVPPEHDRSTDGETPGTSGYADSCAVHLISRSSLHLLNRRIALSGDRPVPDDRFRANIVVAGWPHPHTEDRIRRLTIGPVELAYAKPAIRCAVTLVDQESGRRRGRQPLRALAGYRRTALGLAFGIKLAVTRPGRLAVGDAVVVTTTAVGRRADSRGTAAPPADA